MKFLILIWNLNSYFLKLLKGTNTWHNYKTIINDDKCRRCHTMMWDQERSGETTRGRQGGVAHTAPPGGFAASPQREPSLVKLASWALFPTDRHLQNTSKHNKKKLIQLLIKSTDLYSLLHASALWWRYLAPYTVWWGCVEVRLCCWPIQWCRTPHWGESQRRCGCVAPSSLTRHLYGDTTHTHKVECNINTHFLTSKCASLLFLVKYHAPC